MQACKLYVRQPAEVLDREHWPEYREWLKSRLEAFDAVFRPILSDLDMTVAG